MHLPKVLVLSNTYPRFAGDYSAVFLQTLYTEVASAEEVEITILAADHEQCQEADSNPFLKVRRFCYWWPRQGQDLAYGDAILSNFKARKISVVKTFPFVLSMFINAFLLTRRQRPDLIHAHWTIPCGFVAVLLKRFFSVPVLVTCHGGDLYGLKKWPLPRILTWILRQVNLINVVSPPLLREVGRLDSRLESKTFCLGMGVDDNLFRPVPLSRERLGIDRTSRLLLFVGRLSEVKGISYLLQALPAVLERYPDTLLWVVGQGNLEQELRQMTRDLGLSGTVVFKGPVANHALPVYYSAADLLVLPSVPALGGEEGLPVTVMEALLCQTKVVTTPVGGLKSLIDWPQIFMTSPKDPASLANGIVRALESDYRSNGLERRFAVQEVALKFLQHYRELFEAKVGYNG